MFGKPPCTTSKTWSRRLGVEDLEAYHLARGRFDRKSPRVTLEALERDVAETG